MNKLTEKRPTELTTGVALGAAVYGFLAERGVDNALAAILAGMVAFGPLTVSAVVDRLRRR